MRGSGRPGIRSVMVPVGFAVLVSLCVACDDGGSARPTTTRRPAATTTSTASTTTAPGAPQGTIAPDGGTVVVPSGGGAIGDGAGGPSENDVRSEGLSDGNHVVTVAAIDTGTRTMQVDLVDLLVGDDAVRAYKQDTGGILEGSQVYLRNRNTARRSIHYDPGAGPWSLLRPPSCGPDPTPGPFEDLVTAVQSTDSYEGCSVAAPPFEVTVEGGTITSAAQIPTP